LHLIQGCAASGRGFSLSAASGSETNLELTRAIISLARDPHMQLVRLSIGAIPRWATVYCGEVSVSWCLLVMDIWRRATPDV